MGESKAVGVLARHLVALAITADEWDGNVYVATCFVVCDAGEWFLAILLLVFRSGPRRRSARAFQERILPAPS